MRRPLVAKSLKLASKGGLNSGPEGRICTICRRRRLMALPAHCLVASEKLAHVVVAELASLQEVEEHSSAGGMGEQGPPCWG